MASSEMDITAGKVTLVMFTDKPPEIQPYFLIPEESAQTFPLCLLERAARHRRRRTRRLKG